VTPDGIILNDEMDDFSSPGQINAFGFAASPINYIQPGKRPQSSICSSIVENIETGELVMATGSAGGSQIITATIQQLHHYIDQQYNATQSTGHSRWHDQLSGTTLFELPNLAEGIPGYDNGTTSYMRSLGYNVTFAASGSTSHAISRLSNGDLLAAADPRRPAGYGAAY
jgi:gamma-glutamyltranspeptidase/glutathione hydrolase